MKTSIPLVCAVLLALAGFAVSTPNPTQNEADIVAAAGIDAELSADMHAWEAAFEQARRDHAFALASRSDPESLLGALLIHPREVDPDPNGQGLLPLPADVQQWFVQAREQAGDDPLLAWIEAMRCPVDASLCDRADALQRLHRADPGNAAVWLELMADADARGDVAERDRFFSAAARAPRFDIYDRAFGHVLLNASTGLDAPPMDTDRAAELYTTTGRVLDGQAVPAYLLGVWAAQTLPGFILPMQTCVQRDIVQGNAQRRRECQALFNRIAEDATMAVTAQIGLGTMVRLTRDHPDGAMWRERLRAYRWTYSTILDLVQVSLPAGYARSVLTDGELAAWSSLIENTGRAGAVPDDWLPDTPHIRALILTGRSD